MATRKAKLPPPARWSPPGLEQGVTLDAGGATFVLWSEAATEVTLCLFDDRGKETRIATLRTEGSLHHVYVRGVRAGARYGYRVNGAWDPGRGLRANPFKLLADPYARAFDGCVDTRGPLRGSGRHDDELDAEDDAAFVPKGVVVGSDFAWGADAAPGTPWRDTVIYELHVKGFTKLHPEIAEPLRGTYLGLASEPSIRYLKELGITAVELLPIHHAMDEGHVVRRGLTNYWGYNTLGFFAPDARFAANPAACGSAVHEFKAMVKALHEAGIEVILDVVYNHTCEGNEMGPTVLFRGIDNRAYYRLSAKSARYYENWSGCGNTVDCSHPQVIRLVLDSLRYWITEMHVDGFRFDLAPVLGRERGGSFDTRAALFVAMSQDPVVSRAKVIAEPWDIGPDGFALARFPPPWREWNAHFRDGVRRLWNGHARSLDHLGYRLSGSSDLFPFRGPLAGVNFVTAHDGFTMKDLVSYTRKHNEANGENNEDGTNDNASTNFGVEGETSDPRVKDARERQVRNLFFSLVLSLGVPMITAGDEVGRTQGGNNNAYVRDDPTSWFDWSLPTTNAELFAFVRELLRLRRSTEAFRRSTFFRGTTPPGGKRPDVHWMRPDGAAMGGDDWREPGEMALGMATACDDELLVLLINADAKNVTFARPLDAELATAAFRVEADTSWRPFGASGGAESGSLDGAARGASPGRTARLRFPIVVPARSAILLRAAG